MNQRASDLLATFLGHRRVYSRDFSETLATIARSVDRDWESRRLAAWMLQHQFLCIPEGDDDAGREFLGRMGCPIEPPGELRRRLARMDRILAPIRRGRIRSRAVRDFVEASRSECHLGLARYLFEPVDVARRVRGEARVTEGVPAPFTRRFAGAESRRLLARLPELEAGLIRELLAGSPTYWVADSTSSRINALVEHPNGTVVLVVKPPGSDLEIEIKRAGRRADRPIAIVFDRDGKPVPTSHRLNGASSIEMLQAEAENAAHLAKLYRLVHRARPPVSITVAITYAETIPTEGGGAEQLLDYFANPKIQGEGSRAMSRSVEAFASERGPGLSGLTTGWGPALEFLQYATPAQSLLVGSTMFRLDLLASYLAPDGAARYLGREPKTPGDRDEARRFVDMLLDELLGVHRPPAGRYHSHETYLEACFASPLNRRRAGAVHGSLMVQLGRFWGTVLATRGFSHGESFVARNVGLKAGWSRGRWRVRLLFMDHDIFQLPPTTGDEPFRPGLVLPGTKIDADHVMGPIPRKRPIAGALDHLEWIYRIDKTTADRHHARFREAASAAYHKTQAALDGDTRLRRIVPDAFLKTSRAWDRAVARFLRFPEAEPSPWKAEVESQLAGEGLAEELRRRYVEAIEEHAPLLRRLAFLYTTDSAG
jgi:hypothetical protein